MGKLGGIWDMLIQPVEEHMAAVSPNGRFLAAAAFTADVKVWEIVYQKDGSVKEVSRVMQLNGHKSAVNWLCFAPNSEKIITASKDGSIRLWNINVRYHLDEDPKTLKVFPIPLCDSRGNQLHYDRLSLCPEGKRLAASNGSTLQWLCAETGWNAVNLWCLDSESFCVLFWFLIVTFKEKNIKNPMWDSTIGTPQKLKPITELLSHYLY